MGHRSPFGRRQTEGHVGCGLRIINENKALRIEIDLTIEPAEGAICMTFSVILAGLISLGLLVYQEDRFGHGSARTSSDHRLDQIFDPNIGEADRAV